MKRTVEFTEDEFAELLQELPAGALKNKLLMYDSREESRKRANVRAMYRYQWKKLNVRDYNVYPARNESYWEHYRLSWDIKQSLFESGVAPTKIKYAHHSDLVIEIIADFEANGYTLPDYCADMLEKYPVPF